MSGATCSCRVSRVFTHCTVRVAIEWPARGRHRSPTSFLEPQRLRRIAAVTAKVPIMTRFLGFPARCAQCAGRARPALPGRLLRHALPARTRRPLVGAAIASALLLASCDHDDPMAPPPVVVEEEAEIARPPENPDFLSPRAHLMGATNFSLLSHADTLGGAYRFRVMSPNAPRIERDEFIIVEDGEDGGDFRVRRVLTAERAGDEVVFETATAYWHEVIEGGTYEATVPLGQVDEAGTEGASPLTPSGSTTIPRVQAGLNDMDLCDVTDDLLAAIPVEFRLCNNAATFATAVGAVAVELSGEVTRLLVQEGSIEVTGTMGMATTIDPGGLEGGRRPTFSPCNRGAFTGCITTPTGAALIDWLRYYAPQVPEGGLAPNRVCVPGTPVRVKAGYWYWSGFLYLWAPPEFEQCRVADVGELPTVVLPSVSTFTITPQPRVKGRFAMDVRGSGSLQLKATVPGVTGAAAGGKWGPAALLGTVGLFLQFDLDLYDAGAEFSIDFDEELAITTHWTSADGWDGDVVIEDTNIGGSFQLNGPDSVRARAGITAEVTGIACVALFGACEADTKEKKMNETPDEDGFGLMLKAEAKAVLYRFMEGQYSRTPEDNWRRNTNSAYQFTLKAGLTVPTINLWTPPLPPLEFAPDPWIFGRTDITDLYGTGRLRVTTTTSGETGAQGYSLHVERSDTLPRILVPGAERLGKASDHGTPSDYEVEANGTLMIGTSLPCTVMYSDALLALTGAGVAADVARRLGVGPPNYAITGPCELLIADHEVTLNGVPENCTVAGGATRTVALQQARVLQGQSNITDVEFEVDCAASDDLGSIEVGTTFSGQDPDPDGYQVLVDDAPWGTVGTDDLRTLSGLTAGAREVRLGGVAENCTVVGSNPLPILVAAGAATPVDFEVTCDLLPVPPGSVGVEVETTGDPSPPSDYAMYLDGVRQGFLKATDRANIPGLIMDEPSVLHLAALPDNCRVGGPSPRTVTPGPSFTAGEHFAVDCTAASITPLTGTMTRASTPTPTPVLRLDDGITLRLTGHLAEELLQLDGLPVDVHGVRSGGVLDVYGYALVGSDEIRRWMGIVVERDGDFWLLGEDRMRLVAPSERLRSYAGWLVWVVGDPLSAGLDVQAFGPVREGN